MRAAVTLVLFSCIASAQVSSPDQLFREAVAAQQRGDDAVAVRKYQELLKVQPDIAEARANLGALLVRQGHFDEAIAEYRTALAKSGENPALRFNLALAFYKKGAFDQAAEQLKVLRSATPADVRVSTLLGDCYTHLGQDDQVIAVLAPVAAAHPDDLGVAWLLGAALIRAGHPRDGLELVEKVGRRGKSAEAYLLAGHTSLNLKEFERARDDAEGAVRLNPQLAGVFTLRGLALSYLGDNSSAIAALRKAVEADPGDFDAHLGLGATLHTERDLEGARQHLERALALQPDSNVARYEMAKLERTEGKLDAAVKNFEKVVHDGPDWAQPHIELSALYFRLKRAEDGEREKAVFDRLTAAQQKR